MGLEEPLERFVLHQRRQPRLAEQVLREIGPASQEPPDRHAERRLVAEHASVRGAVQRRGVEIGSGHPGTDANQITPFLAEHLTGEYQLDRVARPVHTSGQAAVDHVFDERRVPQQHHLVDMPAQLGYHPQDLGLVVARGTTMIGYPPAAS